MGLIFLLPLITFISITKSWTYKSYPNLKDESCGLNENSTLKRICDPDGILNPTEVQIFESTLEQMRIESDCQCLRKELCSDVSTDGYVISIAILQNLESLDPKQKIDETVLATFADTIRYRWNQGKCENDVLIVFCQQCKKIHLSHGLYIDIRIPKSIRRDMQIEANHLLSDTPDNPPNHTVIFDFLFHKYYQFFVDLNSSVVDHGANLVTSRAMAYSVADPTGAAVGVKAVIALVAVLSVLWIACVLYLLLITFKRQKGGKIENRNESENFTNRKRSSTFSPWIWSSSASSSPSGSVKITPAEFDLTKKAGNEENGMRWNNSSWKSPQKKLVTFKDPNPPWDEELSLELKLFEEEVARVANVHKGNRVGVEGQRGGRMEKENGQKPCAYVPGMRKLGRIAEVDEAEGIGVTKL